jgi:cyclic-di-GMP phosphodiesterase TipF (flagellum assembly factor)
MLRIGAIFIAVCMVLIAGSIGAVLYLGFRFDAQTAALAALAALVGMVLYQSVSNRLRDRSELGDQIADLSRGTADLARQVAEVSRRLSGLEGSVTSTVNRARSMVDPITTELGELGGLVRQVAETVAAHDAMLQNKGFAPVLVKPEPVAGGPLGFGANDAATGARLFRGLTREEIGEVIAHAIEDNRIDLYLQPIVTLPQRKVRHYEALSRLRAEDGEIIPANDFIEYAESAGLIPRLDNLLLFRCVQVTRRLQLKNRDVGLFCNISALTLSDPTYFRQFLDFMDANRALAPALTLEFSQSAWRSFGPIEQESLSALAERGFRFSMDHVTDLRIEPKDLADHAFRCMKVPASLLLNPATAAQSDIHPADLADLLARSGIDLIAERVENESLVLDLLDYDVRFGQGFLFSPPRPVRAEALQTGAGDDGAPITADPSGVLAAVRAAS